MQVLMIMNMQQRRAATDYKCSCCDSPINSGDHYICVERQPLGYSHKPARLTLDCGRTLYDYIVTRLGS